MASKKKQTSAPAGPRYYLKESNPDKAFFPGVPLRDLSEAEFAALPAYMQASVDASKLYTTQAPAEEAARDDQPGDLPAAAPTETNGEG